MKNIAILGEIGYGNLGDDYGFTLLRDRILHYANRAGLVVNVEALSPPIWGRLDTINYDVVALGCGTLLSTDGNNYVRQLKRQQDRGVPTAVLGSGMSDPRHLPETEEGAELLDDVFENARWRWIRGIHAPCAYWRPPFVSPHSRTRAKKRIGLNMGHAAYTNTSILDIGLRVRTLYERFLVDRDVEPVLVSAWKNDNYWYDRYGVATIQVDGGYASLRALSDLDALVSFRGHLGLTAAICGVRAMPIDFSTKIRDMWAVTNVDHVLLSSTDDDWYTKVRNYVEQRVDNASAVLAASELVDVQVREFVETLK